jgi:hypothetical protein
MEYVLGVSLPRLQKSLKIRTLRTGELLEWQLFKPVSVSGSNQAGEIGSRRQSEQGDRISE